MKDLSDDTVGIFADSFRRAPSIMSSLVIKHLHGAVTLIGATDTTFPLREPG